MFKRTKVMVEKKMDETGLVEIGSKGITNFQMITAIKQNYRDEEKLLMLFNTYEDIFVSSAKYVPDKAKLACEKVIRTKRVITLPIGKKTRMIEFAPATVENVEAAVVEPANEQESEKVSA